MKIAQWIALVFLTLAMTGIGQKVFNPMKKGNALLDIAVWGTAFYFLVQP